MKAKFILLFIVMLVAIGAGAWFGRPQRPVLQFVRHRPSQSGEFGAVFRIVNDSDSPYFYLAYPEGPYVYRAVKTSEGLTYGPSSGVCMVGIPIAKKTIAPHSAVEFETWGGSVEDYKIGMRLFRGTAEDQKPAPEWLTNLEHFYYRCTVALHRADWNPSYIWSDLVRAPAGNQVAKRDQPELELPPCVSRFFTAK